jgi:hypothetical protein
MGGCLAVLAIFVGVLALGAAAAIIVADPLAGLIVAGCLLGIGALARRRGL